jgi:hypothetical protein
MVRVHQRSSLAAWYDRALNRQSFFSNSGWSTMTATPSVCKRMLEINLNLDISIHQECLDTCEFR